MKLLTINSDPNAGGSTISLLHLLAGLKARGVELLVVVPAAGYCSDQLEKLQIPWRVDPYLLLNVWPTLNCAGDVWKFIPRLIRKRIYRLSASRRLKKIIREFRPDIIHTNNSLIDIGFRAARRYGIPHIWHIREYGYEDFGLKYFPSRKCQRRQLTASHTIAITNQLARHFSPGERCRVIYNGICPAEEIGCESAKENYFLYVGAVNENKGVTDLISAYIEYRRSSGSSPLLVIGRYDDAYLSRLKTLLRGTPAENGVRFLGQTDNPYAYMQKAKALIVPSKYEGFGRITAEAMFHGCLVIGRDTAGTQEQFDNGLALTGREIGLRFRTRQELTRALQQADALPDHTRRSMTDDARKTVQALYTTENNIEKTYEFFVSCSGPAPDAGK